MIYVSTIACSNIRCVDAIKILFKKKFSNIEITSSGLYERSDAAEIINFKKNNNINLRCHNYFPPNNDIVINIASDNRDIRNKSVDNIKKSIILNSELNNDKFAFHAGLRYDEETKNYGKRLKKSALTNYQIALDIFKDTYQELQFYASKLGVKIYIENNLLTKYTLSDFDEIPLFLNSFNDYINLKKEFDFNLLLDVGHLKVTSKTLNKDFNQELKQLIKNTDYVHLSDNNSIEDQNSSFEINSDLFKFLKSINLKKKDITLEIKTLEKLKKSFITIKNLTG